MTEPADICRLISPEISDFVEVRGYRCIAEKYAPESFGNAYAILEGADFDLYLVRDRGLIALMIAPAGYGREYSESLMKLTKSGTVNVPEWQSLGSKWLQIAHVFEFLKIAGVEIGNMDNFGANVVHGLENNYLQISRFMRGGLNSLDFAGFVEKKKNQKKINFSTER